MTASPYSINENSAFVYTVSQLTGEIKTLLEETYPFIWVEGEISNLTMHSTGHYFFTLKDEKAQMRAVMFRLQAQCLPFKPESGVHVVVRGRIGVYEPRGEYQIMADFMQPLRKGSLQLAFEQTKRKLEAEGLFDRARKKALPLLPQKIALITSPTGAAIRDILRIMERRFANLEITIIPVRVQGLEAPGEIIGALDLINTLAVEVVILARGGGSAEDLWAFNDEGVARAIARCQVPVVSAVGHEIDFTIADFVADLRAPTPSGAAEMVVEKKIHLIERLETLRGRIAKSYRYSVSNRQKEFALLMKGLTDPRKSLADLSLRIDEASQRLLGLCSQTVQEKGLKWMHHHQTLGLLSPRGKIKSWRQELGRRAERLKALATRKAERTLSALEKLMAQLDGASPLTILKRGYSITRTWPTMEVVRDASALASHQIVHIKLFKGSALCRVEEAMEEQQRG